MVASSTRHAGGDHAGTAALDKLSGVLPFGGKKEYKGMMPPAPSGAVSSGREGLAGAMESSSPQLKYDTQLGGTDMPHTLQGGAPRA